MRARCDWCGMEVEVLASGRCLLGHPLGIDPAQAEAAAKADKKKSQATPAAPRDLKPRRKPAAAPPASAPDLPRSIQKAPTPERPPERILKPVPPLPADPSEIVLSEDLPGGDEANRIPRISRPWAPIEPDGPSGPIGGQQSQPDPLTEAIEPGETGAPPSQPDAPDSPAVRPAVAAAGRPREIDAALRAVLADSAVDLDSPAQTDVPDAAAPTLPSPQPRAPAKTRRMRLPFTRRFDAAPPVDRPAAGRPVRSTQASPKAAPPQKPVPERSLKPVPKPVPESAPGAAPDTKPAKRPSEPRRRSPAAESVAPMLEAIITGRADEPVPAEAIETAPPRPAAAHAPAGITPGTRNPPNPEPVSRRSIIAATPRNTAAWGGLIVALFVAGVAALVLSDGRADEGGTPSLRRIVLTSVSGYTVQPDPETESRLRAELGAQRAVPRQLSAAIVRNPDGDIVALYEAIVFNEKVASSRRDLDDFIALFAEGAGTSADSFAERPLGARTIWSGLLDQGQAILLFDGPEVVIVITAASGADGDTLADRILSARGL